MANEEKKPKFFRLADGCKQVHIDGLPEQNGNNFVPGIEYAAADFSDNAINALQDAHFSKDGKSFLKAVEFYDATKAKKTESDS